MKPISYTSQLLQQYLDIEGETEEKDELFKLLHERVKYMLDHDFQSLLHALYRIDVSEELFTEAIAMSLPNEVSKEVARLIWDRLWEKAKFRAEYKASNT